MPLHAASIVRAGAERVTGGVGAALFVAFLAAFALGNASLNTVLTAVAGTPLPTGGVVSEYGVVLDVHPLVAALGLPVAVALGSVAAVVGIRVLVEDGAGRWRDPTRCLTHRTLPAAGATVAVGAVGLLALAFGTALLVVPGVLVAAYLLVVPAVVALEDVGPVDAVHVTTKRLTRRRALSLAGATAALVGVGLFVAAVTSLTYVLAPATEFGVGVVCCAALAVVWVGVVAEAHTRLGDALRRTPGRTARSTPRSRAL
jgi:hypothetical protein